MGPIFPAEEPAVRNAAAIPVLGQQTEYSVTSRRWHPGKNQIVLLSLLVRRHLCLFCGQGYQSIQQSLDRKFQEHDQWGPRSRAGRGQSRGSVPRCLCPVSLQLVLSKLTAETWILTDRNPKENSNRLLTMLSSEIRPQALLPTNTSPTSQCPPRRQTRELAGVSTHCQQNNTR